MNFRRILANAVARRVAALLVAAALAWLGLGEARAVAYGDQGAAYAGCWSHMNQVIAASLAANPRAEARAGPNTCSELRFNSGTGAHYGYSGQYQYRPSLGAGRYGAHQYAWVADHTFPTAATCASKPSQVRPRLPVSGSIECNSGCSVSYYANGDGETSTVQYNGRVCKGDKSDCDAIPPERGNFVWNSYMGVCQPVAPECPEGYEAHGMECAKIDSCPDGMSLQNGLCKAKEDVCPPGQVRAPDGSCSGDNTCAAGLAKSKSGLCSRDTDGDGIADDDDPDADGDGETDDPNEKKDKNEASGGDTCNAPPSCSGDSIACTQVRIQWRIDCNTRKKADISGGHCGAGGMPVCAGDGCDAREHQQLIQQWKAVCLLEKIAANDGGSGTDPGQGQVPTPDTSGVGEGELADQVPEDLSKADAFSDESGYGPDGVPGSQGLNTAGYGWSRACPAPPTVSLMGQAITFDIGPFCNWMALGGWLVLIMASLLSLRILASAAN